MYYNQLSQNIDNSRFTGHSYNHDYYDYSEKYFCEHCQKNVNVIDSSDNFLEHIYNYHFDKKCIENN